MVMTFMPVNLPLASIAICTRGSHGRDHVRIGQEGFHRSAVHLIGRPTRLEAQTSTVSSA